MNLSNQELKDKFREALKNPLFSQIVKECEKIIGEMRVSENNPEYEKSISVICLFDEEQKILLEYLHFYAYDIREFITLTEKSQEIYSETCVETIEKIIHFAY